MELTEKEKKAREYVCLALDINDKDEILQVVDELWDLVGYFKIHTAFTHFGPEIVKAVVDKGGRVFFDGKFHDIPNTVGNYAEAAAKMKVSVFNLHVAGGKEMMKAAKANAGDAKVIGVTVLTSLDKDIMNNEAGVPGEVDEVVLKRAKLAVEAGLDGVVCSAQDLERIKNELPSDFMFVTPGISMTGAYDDQKRVMTPGKAVKAGSSLLVIGRAIYKAEDRRKAAYEILKDIAEVL